MIKWALLKNLSFPTIWSIMLKFFLNGHIIPPPVLKIFHLKVLNLLIWDIYYSMERDESFSWVWNIYIHEFSCYWIKKIWLLLYKETKKQHYISLLKEFATQICLFPFFIVSTSPFGQKKIHRTLLFLFVFGNYKFITCLKDFVHWTLFFIVFVLGNTESNTHLKEFTTQICPFSFFIVSTGPFGEKKIHRTLFF